MKVKINTRKIIITLFWLLAGAAVLVLLGAAVRSNNAALCKGFEIDINGPAGGQWFLDKADVITILGDKTRELKGRNIRSFDLKMMEKKLKKNVWIRDAQLYFDKNHVLQVQLTERVPVARIFTRNGNSFYIDSSGFALPLSDKVSARVPVFTGFPSAKPLKSDSALIEEMIMLSEYVQHNPFWMAQVAQIEINQQKFFELIPTVGDHIIEFGRAEKMTEKFDRLFLFYKNVLAKRGLGYYSIVKAQYEGQIVGVKKTGFRSRTDSLEAEKKIRSLIHADLKSDSALRAEAIRPAVERKTELPVKKPEQKELKKEKPSGQRVPKAVMKAAERS